MGLAMLGLNFFTRVTWYVISIFLLSYFLSLRIYKIEKGLQKVVEELKLEVIYTT